MIEIKNISKFYKNEMILKDISFTLENEIIAILGKSGCGKSTLLEIIAGLNDQDSGEICPNDKNQFAFMFQDDLLLDNLNIFENVILPLKISKSKIDKNEIDALFRRFEIDKTQEKFPNQLSGGMRQRVALARTFLCKREYFLFDEPFSKLDGITKASLRKWFLTVLKDIKGAIFITHDIEEAIILADKIIILSNSPATIIKEIKPTKEQKDEFRPDFAKLKNEILRILLNS